MTQLYLFAQYKTGYLYWYEVHIYEMPQGHPFGILWRDRRDEYPEDTAPPVVRLRNMINKNPRT